MNWNIYLKAATRQAAIQALASHADVQAGKCPPQVVELVSKAVLLLPEPPPRPPEVDLPKGQIAEPFFPKEIEITTNGFLDLVDGQPQPATIAHSTVMVSLVPAGVLAETKPS